MLRDIIFAGKRHYRELLTSEERISTNILADRLEALSDDGLLTRSDELSLYADILERGGPPMWEAVMDDLREIHLRPAARPHTHSILLCAVAHRIR